MGVSYYYCEICKECIHEAFVYICDCGTGVCDNCMDEHGVEVCTCPEELYEDHSNDQCKWCAEGELQACPACSGKVITDAMAVDYLLKTYKTSLAKIKEEMAEDAPVNKHVMVELDLDLKEEEYSKILELGKARIPGETLDHMIMEWMIQKILEIAMENE